jgi:hypothetical protein
MKTVTEAQVGDALFCTRCVEDHIDFVLDVMAATDKAIKVHNAERNLTVWIPRSALQVNTAFNQMAKDSHGVSCCWHCVAGWFWIKANRQQKLALHLICE